MIKVKISQVKSNPKNPRVIKDDKFKKLVKSIHDFPQMLEKRPLICFTDVDKKYVVLGGNMRLKAIQELGYKDIPDNWIMLADEWTEEKRQEFVIKENNSSFAFYFCLDYHYNPHIMQSIILKNKDAKYAYLFAKSITLLNTNWPETNKVMLRNRRIGLSMTGIAQFIAKAGMGELKNWMDSITFDITRVEYVPLQRARQLFSECPPH